MKKKNKEFAMVINTKENELYYTLGGKRLSDKQVEMYKEYLEKKELMDILGEDSNDDGQKEKTNDALWAIADDMRERKKRGKFPTYRKAYEWASENLSKDDALITPQNLERAWHKAKSEGKV